MSHQRAKGPSFSKSLPTLLVTCCVSSCLPRGSEVVSRCFVLTAICESSWRNVRACPLPNFESHLFPDAEGRVVTGASLVGSLPQLRTEGKGQETICKEADILFGWQATVKRPRGQAGCPEATLAFRKCTGFFRSCCFSFFYGVLLWGCLLDRGSFF